MTKNCLLDLTAIPKEDWPNEFWVFAYGSLMWDPGFAYAEVIAGQIEGYQRSLSVLSTIYRGTPDNPGLVMGLDKGGACCGRVFRVVSEHVEDTVSYLDEREQVTKVYCPQFIETQLSDGRTVKAYTFVVRREHEQYAGGLSLQEQARLVAQGVGKKGPALEYLTNTIEHIDNMGITDSQLHEVLDMARAMTA